MWIQSGTNVGPIDFAPILISQTTSSVKECSFAHLAFWRIFAVCVGLLWFQVHDLYSQLMDAAALSHYEPSQRLSEIFAIREGEEVSG